MRVVTKVGEARRKVTGPSGNVYDCPNIAAIDRHLRTLLKVIAEIAKRPSDDKILQAVRNVYYEIDALLDERIKRRVRRS